MQDQLAAHRSTLFSTGIKLGLRLLALTALVAAGSLSADNATNVNTDAETFSPANTVLFASNHMQRVKPDQALVYDLQQSGTMVETMKDTITLKLAAKDNHTEANVEFMTGERKRWTPAFTDPKGNPVLMLFLQTDIHDMERTNGGQWRHFQKYIKLALEQADVKDTTFLYAGKTLHGKEVSIQPYANDPEKDRFINPAFIKKQYEFIISDQVPGGLYKIATDVPGASADQPVAHKELLLRER